MNFAPVFKRSVAFAFVKRKLCINLIVWRKHNGHGLDDAAGVARAVDDGSQVAGLERRFLFVFPFPQCAAGCGFLAFENWNKKFVGHLWGVAEVVGVDLARGDLWIVARVGLAEAIDEGFDLRFVWRDHEGV